jgi:hypothetical protein
MEIFLGHESEGEQTQVTLPGSATLRHTVCLGASGSGKTVACKVICEEFLLAGVPVVALDPQGDIASMILPGDPEEIATKGLDAEVATRFHQNVEVVIWTPGSHAGVPLCLDPLRLEGLPTRKSERIRVLSAIAGNLTAILGYSLDSNDGQFASAYLDLALQYLAEHRIRVKDLSGLAAFLHELPEALLEEANRVIKESKREEIGRKIQVLGIGARKLLFQMGAPVDMDILLGKDLDADAEPAEAAEGEEPLPAPTRLSVIYLNTLHAQEEKDFFVSQIGQRLYDWMLKNPASEPQALFYIDEIAPFLPPVRKPACKDVLKLLFKQARKYGISCLIASQNPGDVDYTALAKFSTCALGRMMIRQDIKKIEKIIRAMSPDEVESIVETLPSLDPGQFLLISPDVYERVVSMRVRWLYTRHETLDEDRVEELISDEMRERLGRHIEEDEILEPIPASEPEPEPELEEEEEPEATLEEEEEFEEEEESIELEEDKPTTHKDMLLKFLKEHPGAYTVKELTHEVAVSESLVRRNVKELVASKRLATAKVGRSHFYWRQGQRFEPSVGIVRPVMAISPRIDQVEATNIAEGERSSVLFGLWKNDNMEGPVEKYLLLWQVAVVFEKTTGMLMFRNTEHKEATLYFHAKTGRLLSVGEREPFDLLDNNAGRDPDTFADLSGLGMTPHTPGELRLQSRTLKACKSPEAIYERCRVLFGAEAKQPHLVAFPYWSFTLRGGDATQRQVNVDGLYGHVFTIPKR